MASVQQQDSLDAIVQYLRGDAKDLRNGVLSFVGPNKLDWLADRIEAAVKRDQAPGPSSGNAAKIREALEAVNAAFDDSLICTDYQMSDAELDRMDEVWRKVKTALGAPARNCDKYGADGAAAACRKALGIDWSHIILVRKVIGWLFAPAEGGAK